MAIFTSVGVADGAAHHALRVAALDAARAEDHDVCTRPWRARRELGSWKRLGDASQSCSVVAALRRRHAGGRHLARFVGRTTSARSIRWMPTWSPKTKRCEAGSRAWTRDVSWWRWATTSKQSLSGATIASSMRWTEAVDDGRAERLSLVASRACFRWRSSADAARRSPTTRGSAPRAAAAGAEELRSRSSSSPFRDALARRLRAAAARATSTRHRSVRSPVRTSCRSVSAARR